LSSRNAQCRGTGYGAGFAFIFGIPSFFSWHIGLLIYIRDNKAVKFAGWRLDMRNFSDEEIIAMNDEFVADGGDEFDFSPVGASPADNERISEMCVDFWAKRGFGPWRTTTWPKYLKYAHGRGAAI
jgi:hypothetical protein